MADVNKRIVVEVDAKDAEQGLAPVQRILDDITKDAQYSGEAVSTAFENALKHATTFEDILKRVKEEFSEINRNAPDFGKERERIQKQYGEEIDNTAPGKARQLLVQEKQEKLNELRQDEIIQQRFNQEFGDNSRRLVEALKELADEEKKIASHRGAPEGSYLGGLFAERSALISKQLSAPTRGEAKEYNDQIEDINRRISDVTEPSTGTRRALTRAGLGVGGAMVGSDVGMLAAVGGGTAAAIAVLGTMIVSTIREGLQTLQQTNRASLVAPASVSPFGPTGPNGETLEGGLFDTRTGMSPSERTQYYLSYVRQRGRADQFSGVNSYNQALLENAFGLNRGELMPLERFRMRDTSGTGTNNLVEAFLQAGQQQNLFGFGKDDFSQLSDRLGNVIQLMRDQQQNMSSVNMASGFSALMMGQQIGGRFADRDTQVGLFGQLNNSIRNPGNDFRRAFIYQRLQQANPDLSPYQLMEKMQNGIYGGNLQSILGGLQIPGSGASQEEIDNYLYQVQGLTGLDYQAAGTLGRSLIRNPSILNSQQSNAQLLQSIGANPNFRDLQGRTVDQRAQASLTFQQEIGSFLKQKMSDIGVYLNKIAEGIDGPSGTNSLLKSILSNPEFYFAPGIGILHGAIQSGNVTHKPSN